MDYDNFPDRPIEIWDIDNIFYYRGFLIQSLGFKKLEVFKTNKGFHVRVYVEKELTPEQIILVQLLMGSDLHREIYDILRVFDESWTVDEWNKLYTKKFLMIGTKITGEISGEKPYRKGARILLRALRKNRDMRGNL